MRLLMIYPENQVGGKKPIAIPLLSAILKKNGHTVDFIDTSVYDQSDFLKRSGVDGCGPPFKKPNYFKRPLLFSGRPKLGRSAVPITRELESRLLSFKPEAILVSASTIAFYHCLKILSKIGTDIPVIFGGYHTMGNAESAIKQPGVRIICIGEGEDALPRLLSKMEEGRHYYDTPNFYFKDDKGRIIRNQRLPLKEELDDLPFLDYSIFNNDYHFYRAYRGKYFRMGDISHTRGCLNSCSFCFYSQYYELFNQKNHTIRAFSPKRAIEEIDYLTKSYHLDFFRFHSSDFLALSEEYIHDFSLLYRKKINLPNIINASVKQVTGKKAEFLRRMRCVSVSLGVEAGNQDYRSRVLNKHFSNDELVERAAMLRSQGIRVTSSNMVFLPHETRQIIFENVMLQKKAKIELMDYSPFYPFPGLRITQYCKSNGLLKSEIPTDILISENSVLDGPIPNKEQSGIYRTLYLYKEFPVFLWGLIRIAEVDTAPGRVMHAFLHALYHLCKYGIDFDSKLNWARRKRREYSSWREYE